MKHPTPAEEKRQQQKTSNFYSAVILQFEKRPISELFTAFDSDNPEGRFANQLLLFDL